MWEARTLCTHYQLAGCWGPASSREGECGGGVRTCISGSLSPEQFCCFTFTAQGSRESAVWEGSRVSFRVTPGCWGVLPVVRLSRNVRGSEAGVASHRPCPVLSLLLKTVPGAGPKSHESSFHSQMARAVEPRGPRAWPQDSCLA